MLHSNEANFSKFSQADEVKKSEGGFSSYAMELMRWWNGPEQKAKISSSLPEKCLPEMSLSGVDLGKKNVSTVESKPTHPLSEVIDKSAAYVKQSDIESAFKGATNAESLLKYDKEKLVHDGGPKLCEDKMVHDGGSKLSKDEILVDGGPKLYKDDMIKKTNPVDRADNTKYGVKDK